MTWKFYFAFTISQEATVYYSTRCFRLTKIHINLIQHLGTKFKDFLEAETCNSLWTLLLMLYDGLQDIFIVEISSSIIYKIITINKDNIIIILLI